LHNLLGKARASSGDFSCLAGAAEWSYEKLVHKIHVMNETKRAPANYIIYDGAAYQFEMPSTQQHSKCPRQCVRVLR
jgi:hypothetical protein